MLILPTGSEMQVRKGITPSDVHVNRPLSNLSVAWIQSQSLFVADRVFPRIPVQKQSDLYYVYNRGDWNRNEMGKRAPGTETKGGTYNMSTSPYFCDVYGVHRDVDDQLRANADDPINPDREATQWVTQKGLIFRERQFATDFFSPGVWTNQKAGVAATPGANQFLQWDVAASEPMKDVKAWKDAVLLATGFIPNVLVLGHQVWTALTENASIIDRIKYGQTPGSPAQVTKQAIAALMEIERIEVMSAIVNNAAETAGGTGTESNAFIGGKNALVCYSAPNPGLMTPSAGYTFVWSGYAGSGAYGQRISSFRMDNIRADRVELELAFDHKMVSNEMGVFAQTVIG